MCILNVENLNLVFQIGENVYQALHKINFSLKQGEMLALIGESGCGKTITAMSILKLLPNNAKITSGQILYNGSDIISYNEKQMLKIRGKEIALVPQDPMSALNPLYTIESQLIEIIKAHTGLQGEEAKKNAIEVLDLVKIPNAKERLKSYPHEFSGGMRQRVIIAMAIACKAKIIIADEPTTALDVTVQAQIMELLKNIQKEFNTSFIFISHDFGLVYEAADNACVMYNGRIIEKSSVKELFNSPKHPYTKALIKTLPDFNTTNLETIQGQPPSVKDVFTGCPFEPRCKSRMNECTSIIPNFCKVDNSIVSCLLFNKYKR